MSSKTIVAEKPPQEVIVRLRSKIADAMADGRLYDVYKFTYFIEYFPSEKKPCPHCNSNDWTIYDGVSIDGHEMDEGVEEYTIEHLVPTSVVCNTCGAQYCPCPDAYKKSKS